MTSYKTGIFSELLACIYLRLHGFRILKRRFVTGRYTGRAEIDIIAKRDNLILFIEVKHRKNLITGLDAVTKKQSNRLRNAAESYLAKIKWNGNARFDIIVVTPPLKIKWIKEAF